MRNKSRWIVILVLVILFVLIVGPFISGLFFERQYRKVLQVYRDNQVDVQLLEYKRKWFDSKAVLSVNFKFLANENFPTQYIIDQDIQHGPLFYRYRNTLPALFGLGAIHSQLRSTPEINQLFEKYHLNVRDVDMSDDYINLCGNYYKHIKLSAIQASFLGNDIRLQVGEVEGTIGWLTSNAHFNGHLFLRKILLADSEGSIDVPSIEIQFDQRGDAENFWLGSNALIIPKLVWTEASKAVIQIEDIQFKGFFEEKSGIFNGMRELTIAQMQVDKDSFGPFQLQLSVSNLNAKAVFNLVRTYREISERGELYQSQLSQNILTILPTVINSGSGVTLDRLNLETPEGNLKIQAKMTWDMNKEALPSNFAELIQSANGQLDLRVAKNLIQKWIAFVSHMTSLAQENARESVSTQSVMQTQLNSWLQAGYIKEDNNDYVMSLSQNESGVKINGKLMSSPED